MPRRPNACQAPYFLRRRGFILMGLLVIMALAGIALMAAVDVWAMQRQREREQELLFVGNAYREAIRHYYFGAPPGSPRTLPRSLEALLEDDRYPVPVRHLRRLYPDPVTGKAEWGELRVGDFIAGVFSRSEAQPIKQAGFSTADIGFAGQAMYTDWVFVFSEAPGVAGALEKAGKKPATPPAPALSRPVLGGTT